MRKVIIVASSTRPISSRYCLPSPYAPSSADSSDAMRVTSLSTASMTAPHLWSRRRGARKGGSNSAWLQQHNTGSFIVMYFQAEPSMTCCRVPPHHGALITLPLTCGHTCGVLQTRTPGNSIP